MFWAKQSTAATVVVGPILDSAGAEYASAVIGDLSISKNGGTLTALASAASLTLIANGQYTLVLRTTDFDTLGRAQILCNKSTYQIPAIEFMVIPATVYDALVTNATNTTGGLPAATAAIAGLSGTIATTTNITAATGITVSTNSDKTGYSLTATTGLGNQTANITGTITTVTTATNVTTVNGLASNVITAASIAADAVTEIQSGLATPTNITAASGIAVASIGNNVITAASLATDAVNEIVDQTWDELLSGHAISGSTGAGLSAAGGSGDPWSTALPGAYGVGTAGKIIGDNINAAIDSRMATYTQPTGFLAATFPTTVASTTNITGGTITTVTNLTNAPTSGDLTATMKTSVTTAATAATPIAASVTGAVGSVVGLTPGNLDATVSSRASQTSLNTLDDYVDTEIAAIQTTLGTPAGASMSADVASVKTDTTTLLTRITTTFATLVTNLTAMITGSGASAAYTTTAMANAPAGGGGGTLTGDFAIAVTIEDSSDDAPIQNAKVRLYRSGFSGTQATNVSGLTTFGCDAATWSVVVTASGYTAYTGTLVVTANASVTIQLTAHTEPTTPIAGTCEVIDYVLDSGLSPVEGAIVRAVASPDAELADSGILTQLITKATTDADGRFSLRLARKDAMTAGKEYTIEIRHDARSIYRKITGEVPNQSSCLLKAIVPAV